MTDRGCPKGDQCTFAHPRKPGKCLRCGGVNHDLSTCLRPAWDAKLNPRANAKVAEREVRAIHLRFPRRGREREDEEGLPRPSLDPNLNPRVLKEGERMQFGRAKKSWKRQEKEREAA